MGYCVTMEIEGLEIPRSKVKACREAINAMFDPKRMIAVCIGGPWGPGNKRTYHYSWVDNPPKEGFAQLVDAFHAWRYDAFVDEDTGNVVIESFCGEKLGDDDQLYSVIAPFVKKGAVIECRGEDGDLWRILFDGKTVKEQMGRVVYEDVD